MKRLQQLTRDINELTLKIEQDFPELYQFLNETPITIPSSTDPINTKNFSDYLDSLKQILERHIENQSIKSKN